jgi:AraC-like DNA-binding protein
MILDDLTKDPSLAELASLCGLSVSHFARAFKQGTGTPPHRWLISKRVERAQKLLVASDAPISEIAQTCGFADQSHLTRVFTRAVGASPGVWRRERKH